MRLSHVLYSGLGGHSAVLFAMAPELRAFGAESQAIFYGVEPLNPDSAAKCESLGIPYLYVPKRPGPEASSSVALFRALKQQSSDGVLLHGSRNILPAFLYGRMRRAKVVVRETQANRLKTRGEWLFLFLSLALADNVVVLSPQYRQEVARAFSGTFAGKMRVVPNGLDLAFYSPAAQRPDDGLLRIGMQSRLVGIKDHPSLIRAFALLRNLPEFSRMRLEIAGDGPTLQPLRALAESLGIAGQVTFTGRLGEAELLAFLQRQDIYVHATLGETQSNAIMQAQAVGLPVIASDVEGVSNVITPEKDGLLVPPRDPEALAAAIRSLVASPSRRRELGEASRLYAQQHYGAERMARDYGEVFGLTV